MRTRTRLTTPPGAEPADEASDGARTGVERYRHFLERPREPRWPGRHRRLVVTVTAVVIVVLAGVLAYRLTTAGQFQDPSLGSIPGEP